MKLNRSRLGWKVESVVIPETGEHYNRYFFKRVRAKRIPLKSKLAMQLGGYALIERDLRIVGTWLEEMHKHCEPLPENSRAGWGATRSSDEEHPIVQSLFVSSVSFYGKCFSQCDGRKIKLDKKWVPHKFEDTHDLLIQMRNNFTAHSGATKFERVNVALVLAAKGNKLKDEALLYRELYQAESMRSLSSDDSSFEQLVEVLHEKVLLKLKSLNDKIFKEEINPKGMSYWLSLK